MSSATVRIPPAVASDLATKVSETAPRLGSVEAVETWLKDEPGVEAVRVEPYWIKTNPPRREVVVTLRLGPKETVERSLLVSVNLEGHVLGAHFR